MGGAMPCGDPVGSSGGNGGEKWGMVVDSGGEWG
jgi:hypothetical protein